MSVDRFKLLGKVAIVTGAARGLGAAIAKVLSEAGASCVIADVDVDGAKRVAEEISSSGQSAIAVRTDISKRTDVDELVRKTLKEFGRIDILVNDAGIAGERLPAEDVREEEWNRILSVNLTGTFLCSQAAGKVMIKQKSGAIINIASMSGMIVNKGRHIVGYCVSKAGVIMLTKVLAVEWAPYGIRVNAIAPGYILTELTKIPFADPNIYRSSVELTPIGRVAEPHEFETAILFLASPASSFITGHTLVIDGGYTCL